MENTEHLLVQPQSEKKHESRNECGSANSLLSFVCISSKLNTVSFYSRRIMERKREEKMTIVSDKMVLCEGIEEGQHAMYTLRLEIAA